MATCVHHIPGRLRIRVQGLARTGDGGEQLRAQLAELDGVRLVTVNCRAGSVTVVYDPDTVQPAVILGRIAGRPGMPPGMSLSIRPAAAPAPNPLIAASATKIGGLFGRALVDALLAKGVERSVRLLVRSG
jgi:Heavy metal associated domain 2